MQFSFLLSIGDKSFSGFLDLFNAVFIYDKGFFSDIITSFIFSCNNY